MGYLHKIKIGFYDSQGNDKFSISKLKSDKKLSYCEVAQRVKTVNKNKTIWYLNINEILEI